MKFTKKQFDEIGPWYFNDLCFDSINQTMMLKIFNLLPSHLQGQAVSWGCDDTVFRDEVFKYLVENQFGMTTEEYYESDKFQKGIYQKISFKKLKPKVIQVDIETEGGPYTYMDGVLVTQDAAINLSGVQESLIKEMGKGGDGYKKSELGVIMAPAGHGKAVHLEDMMKNIDAVEMSNRKRDKDA